MRFDVVSVVVEPFMCFEPSFFIVSKILKKNKYENSDL